MATWEDLGRWQPTQQQFGAQGAGFGIFGGLAGNTVGTLGTAPFLQYFTTTGANISPGLALPVPAAEDEKAWLRRRVGEVLWRG